MNRIEKQLNLRVKKLEEKVKDLVSNIEMSNKKNIVDYLKATGLVIAIISSVALFYANHLTKEQNDIQQRGFERYKKSSELELKLMKEQLFSSKGVLSILQPKISQTELREGSYYTLIDLKTGEAKYKSNEWFIKIPIKNFGKTPITSFKAKCNIIIPFFNKSKNRKELRPINLKLSERKSIEGTQYVYPFRKDINYQESRLDNSVNLGEFKRLIAQNETAELSFHTGLNTYEKIYGNPREIIIAIKIEYNHPYSKNSFTTFDCYIFSFKENSNFELYSNKKIRNEIEMSMN
jgi:hypothetical protein